MKLQIFSVYDKAVQAFVVPFFSRSKGEAVRSFTEAANTADNNLHKHAMDYVLMYLGEYDDSSGTFAAVEPVRVISASEVLVDEVFTKETELPPDRPLVPPSGNSRKYPM